MSVTNFEGQKWWNSNVFVVNSTDSVHTFDFFFEFFFQFADWKREKIMICFFKLEYINLMIN